MTKLHAVTAIAAFIFLVLWVYEVYFRKALEPVTVTTVEHRFVLEPPIELKANIPYTIIMEAEEDLVGRYVSVDKDVDVQTITVFGRNTENEWTEEEP